tara:strand:+ start:7231 stop:9414 length:2184 start_codon:yes stop_codon:yes gene_type:complete
MALSSLCRFPVFRHALLLAASCLIFSSGKGQGLEQASQSLPTLLIHQVVEGPILDGNVSDPCWENASLARNFTQRQPDEGEPATEATEVRICRDATTLYLAVRCYDQQPEEIVATVMQRDATVKGDDYFFVLIDPYQRGRDGYYFRTNANGAKGEGLINSDYSRPNMDWDTIWEVKSRIDQRGWTAEFAIPFRSIPFDLTSTSWGIDFGRWFARNQERSRWVGFARERQWFSIEETGVIEGMEDLETGKGIDFKPYALAKYFSTEETNDFDFESGFDLFYQWTPSLTATLTFNTDFAETETDQRRVNLTRFPLFFPEKREFFLKGADQFAFGGLSKSPLPFHSRTIGLSQNGQVIDVEGGLKITGREGALGIGMLGMKLDSDDIGDGDVYVGRFTYDLMEESKVGMIFTSGDPQANMENNLMGLDLNLRNSDWWEGKSISLHSYVMSTEDAVKGTDQVFGSSFSFPNYPLRLGGHFLHTGDDFEPAMGFVSRTGGQSSSISSSYSLKLEDHSLIDDLTFGVAYNRYDLLDGGLDSEEVNLKIIEFRTHEGDRFDFSVEIEREVLTTPFEIVDGIEIATGDYQGIEFEIEWSTSAKRPFFMEMEIEYGDYYAGDAWKFESELAYRPNRYARFEVGGEFTNADMPVGDFDVWTTFLGVRLTPNTKLSFNSVTQYDNLSKSMGLNNRIRYIIKPGSDLYLVFNQGYDREEGSFKSTRTESISKLGWTFQF